ncbi:UDP-N-acetyl-D-mannosaminouronate:lipid I N-acetyl-D-mannosaminouronosyltransferase [Nicoletella semolina]|uniref:UDP-N-acetyl-D-mannosaminouronate:lipid I N-acetyl-D-mannosaminouronosyltransferase n=1 Tax=Nicoletella semolina TaxID=271160 RepID=A0A4R2N4I8_9PAST|nr:lipopolysaccharide N-acetylmannosaminouronosyltransferase [Nicoletella semolina]MDH2924549.1 lipopolysaccharide N-acetylmannosaminouronosyltransferase [Nicoletella semolina]TCP15769.1 UDP-N-acetyl-D-mannosaminouronate:lipid I N-acetyl-D-mannosaminouronosyltransferase [Nicoletella semolina]
MNKVNIRNIAVITAAHQQNLLDFLLEDNRVKFGRLFAINAEKVILSGKRSDLAECLQHAEFCYADGISIILSIRRKYPELANMERIAGADLWLALMNEAARQGVPVFILGSSPVVLADTVEKLKYMGVNVVGQYDGYFSAEYENELIAAIQHSGAKIVSVALGSPKQELFIQRAYMKYPFALYMGVGGTYDVFTGRVKRAPKLWQKYGVEWLYRAITQPRRWKRQLNLIKYAYYYWFNKL